MHHPLVLPTALWRHNLQNGFTAEETEPCGGYWDMGEPAVCPSHGCHDGDTQRVPSNTKQRCFWREKSDWGHDASLPLWSSPGCDLVSLGSSHSHFIVFLLAFSLISLWSKNYLSHSVLRCSPSQIPSGRWCPSHSIVWARDSHPLSLVPMATRWVHFFCLLLIWAFQALSRSLIISVLQPSLNQVINSVPTEWSKLCLNV